LAKLFEIDIGCLAGGHEARHQLWGHVASAVPRNAVGRHASELLRDLASRHFSRESKLDA
jgi:hypothetical protein